MSYGLVEARLPVPDAYCQQDVRLQEGTARERFRTICLPDTACQRPASSNLPMTPSIDRGNEPRRIPEDDSSQPRRSKHAQARRHRRPRRASSGRRCLRPDEGCQQGHHRTGSHRRQKGWCSALVSISDTYAAQGLPAAKQLAAKVVDEAYGYQMGAVLFKPTLAAAPQSFRTTREGAISYFVGGDQAFPHDHGFALSDEKKCDIENAAVFIGVIRRRRWQREIHRQGRQGDRRRQDLGVREGRRRQAPHHGPPFLPALRRRLTPVPAQDRAKSPRTVHGPLAVRGQDGWRDLGRRRHGLLRPRDWRGIAARREGHPDRSGRAPVRRHKARRDPERCRAKPGPLDAFVKPDAPGLDGDNLGGRQPGPSSSIDRRTPPPSRRRPLTTTVARAHFIAFSVRLPTISIRSVSSTSSAIVRSNSSSRAMERALLSRAIAVQVRSTIGRSVWGPDGSPRGSWRALRASSRRITRSMLLTSSAMGIRQLRLSIAAQPPDEYVENSERCVFKAWARSPARARAAIRSCARAAMTALASSTNGMISRGKRPAIVDRRPHGHRPGRSGPD